MIRVREGPVSAKRPTRRLDNVEIGALMVVNGMDFVAHDDDCVTTRLDNGHGDGWMDEWWSVAEICFGTNQ